MSFLVLYLLLKFLFFIAKMTRLNTFDEVFGGLNGRIRLPVLMKLGKPIKTSWEEIIGRRLNNIKKCPFKAFLSTCCIRINFKISSLSLLFGVHGCFNGVHVNTYSQYRGGICFNSYALKITFARKKIRAKKRPFRRKLQYVTSSWLKLFSALQNRFNTPTSSVTSQNIAQLLKKCRLFLLW